jgi:hypothetical protein
MEPDSKPSQFPIYVKLRVFSGTVNLIAAAVIKAIQHVEIHT